MPRGTATKKVTKSTKEDPIQADKIPALAARRDG